MPLLQTKCHIKTAESAPDTNSLERMTSYLMFFNVYFNVYLDVYKIGKPFTGKIDVALRK